MSRYETRYVLSNTEFEIEDYDTLEDACYAALKRTRNGSMRPGSARMRAIRADVLRMDGRNGTGTVVFSACGSGSHKY